MLFKMEFYVYIIYKLERVTLKHNLGKALLQEKMSQIKEHYFLIVFLNADIKFKASRRMLS